MQKKRLETGRGCGAWIAGGLCVIAALFCAWAVWAGLRQTPGARKAPAQAILAGVPFYDGPKEETEGDAAGYLRILECADAERIEAVLVSEGIFCICDGAHFGYLTEEGVLIAPFVYEDASPFHEGLACVSRGGKYGYLDTEGEVAIPFRFDRAAPFAEGMAYFADGERYGFMDHDGEVLFYLDCESVSSFQDGLARICVGGRYGYIDSTGRTVIEPLFDDAGYFSDGIATVVLDGKLGVIDRDGAWALRPEYDDIGIRDGSIVAQAGESCACFDMQGNPVFAEACDGISVDGAYICFRRDGKWGLADQSGVRIAPEYDSITVVEERGLVIAGRDGSYGVIDLDGEEKLPFTYDWMRYDTDISSFVVLKEGKYGCVDALDFSERIPAVYDSIGPFYGGRAAAERDGAYDLIRWEDGADQGWEPRYDRLQLFEDGSMLCGKDSVWLVCDSSGWPLGGGVYDSVMRFGDGYRTSWDGKYGFLDGRGRLAAEPSYGYVLDYGVRGARNVYVTTCYGDGILNGIVLTGETEETDLTELLLRDEITPGAGHFYRWMREAEARGTGGDCSDESVLFYRTYRLYDPNHTGERMLMYAARPYQQMNFPMSCTGLYVQGETGMVELASGYECGGSLRGDYVCLWQDLATGEILPGLNGSWGGFGGYAGTGKVFAYDASAEEAEEVCSFEWISQTAHNYSEEELLAHPELFYDKNGEAYTAETILQADAVEAYYVDGVQVTAEAYDAASGRYRMIIPR